MKIYNPFTMKIRTSSFPSLISATMLILIVFLFSCKKKDITYQPISPNPTDPSLNVFLNLPLCMLTPEELAGTSLFPGYLHHALGKQLGGVSEGGFPYEKVGDLLMDIHKDKEAKEEYETIKNDLNQISAQLVILNQEVLSLSQQLQISTTDIESMLSSMSLEANIRTIKTSFSTTDHRGLIYYAQQADTARFFADSTQRMKTLDSLARNNYAYGIYTLSNPDIEGAIAGINTTICNPVYNQSPMKLFVDNLINKGVNIQDTAKAMMAYRMLENFFLYLLNAQFQGVTILCNVDSLVGSPGEFHDYYTGSFTTMINNELTFFLKTVDYLMINLTDYRTPGRFNYDLHYADAGLAPDPLFYNVFARSRFVNNLIVNALGENYNPVQGLIIVPRCVFSGTNVTVFLDNYWNPLVSDPSITLTSIYPNTVWTKNSSSKTGNCSPDNQWISLHVQGPGSDTQGGITGIEVNGDPWTHSVPIKGHMSVKWYNPQQPDPKTATNGMTSTNTMELGCFSGLWNLGELYLTNSDFNSYWWHLNPYFHYSINSKIRGPVTSAPVNGTTDGQNILWPHSQGGFSNPTNNAAWLKFNAYSDQTSNGCVLSDAVHTNIQVTFQDNPPMLAPSAKIWCNWSVNWAISCSYWDMYIWIGTQIDQNSEGYVTNPDMVKNTYSNYHPSEIDDNFCQSSNLQENTGYQPGFAYYLWSQKTQNQPAYINFRQTSQVIYGGTYSIEN